jgi:hypothetical protein
MEDYIDFPRHGAETQHAYTYRRRSRGKRSCGDGDPSTKQRTTRNDHLA